MTSCGLVNKQKTNNFPRRWLWNAKRTSTYIRSSVSPWAPAWWLALKSFSARPAWRRVVWARYDRAGSVALRQFRTWRNGRDAHPSASCPAMWRRHQQSTKKLVGAERPQWTKNCRRNPSAGEASAQTASTSRSRDWWTTRSTTNPSKWRRNPAGAAAWPTTCNRVWSWCRSGRSCTHRGWDRCSSSTCSESNSTRWQPTGSNQTPCRTDCRTKHAAVRFGEQSRALCCNSSHWRYLRCAVPYGVQLVRW